MPFLPNVPHIVGDDDEPTELDDQTQMTNAANNITEPDATTKGEKLSDSDSSNLSDCTSYDDDTDDEDSNRSTQEEEDWSNSISYIVRTPERVPDQEETPLPSTEPEILPSPAVEVEVVLTEDLQAATEQPLDLSEEKKAENDKPDLTEDIQAHDAMECEKEDQPKSVAAVASNELGSPVAPNKLDSPLAVYDLCSPKTVSPVASNELLSPVASNRAGSPLVPNEPSVPMADEPMDNILHSSSTPPENDSEMEEDAKSDAKILKEDEESTLDNVTLIEPMEESRRLSLRSAYRASLTKSEASSTKTQRGRSRALKSKAKNENSTTPPKTIGARVAKRSRPAVIITNSSPIAKKSPEKLAKPIEVTEYFTKISATLVSHRINLLPFLYMRKRIDRLVGEAIAKTRST